MTFKDLYERVCEMKDKISDDTKVVLIVESDAGTHAGHVASIDYVDDTVVLSDEEDLTQYFNQSYM